MYHDNQQDKAQQGQNLLLTPSEEGFLDVFFPEFFGVDIRSASKDDARLRAFISDGSEGWKQFYREWEKKENARRRAEQREADAKKRAEAETA